MSDFVPLKNYSTPAEAEMHAEILRAEGIAAIVQGPQPGIFGAGFAGLSIQGVTLLVPEDRFDEAFDLVGDEDGSIES